MRSSGRSETFAAGTLRRDVRRFDVLKWITWAVIVAAVIAVYVSFGAYIGALF
jgi:hypothetical protein